jgi:hypothetical protein
MCLLRNTRVTLKSVPFAQGWSCLIIFFDILDTPNYKFIPSIAYKIAGKYNVRSGTWLVEQ